MELIVISETKIKLMLTKQELEAYSGDTMEVIRGIMCEARRNSECPCLDGRIFIEMYPSVKGGCELFVTGLGEGHESIVMRTGEERVLTEYKKPCVGESGRRAIYSFESMGCLLDCCMGMLRTGYRGESRAYIDRGRGVYYLVLECETHVAGENFGSLCPMRTYYYISEHCDVICADSAVEKLGVLA